MSRTSRNDWCVLSFRFYRDPVLRAIGQESVAALAMWPILIAKAKEQSHHVDNPGAVITIAKADLFSDVCVDAKDGQRALDLLVEGEMIEVETGKLGLLSITLPTFEKWNSIRGSERDNKRIQRHQPGAFAGEKPGSVQSESSLSPVSVQSQSTDKTRQDKTRQDETTPDGAVWAEVQLLVSDQLLKPEAAGPLFGKLQSYAQSYNADDEAKITAVRKYKTDLADGFRPKQPDSYIRSLLKRAAAGDLVDPELFAPPEPEPIDTTGWIVE